MEMNDEIETKRIEGDQDDNDAEEDPSEALFKDTYESGPSELSEQKATASHGAPGSAHGVEGSAHGGEGSSHGHSGSMEMPSPYSDVRNYNSDNVNRRNNDGQSQQRPNENLQNEDLRNMSKEGGMNQRPNEDLVNRRAEQGSASRPTDSSKDQQHQKTGDFKEPALKWSEKGGDFKEPAVKPIEKDSQPKPNDQDRAEKSVGGSAVPPNFQKLSSGDLQKLLIRK